MNTPSVWFGVEAEPQGSVASDASTGAQPQAVTRPSNPWWKLGYNDGRLGAGALHASAVVAAEAEMAHQAEIAARESELETSDAALRMSDARLRKIEDEVDEVLRIRQHTGGAAWAPPSYGRLVPLLYAFFAVVSFLADLALAENVVRNGFNIFPRESAFSWLIYVSMIAGITVFGAVFKAALAAATERMGRWGQHVEAAFVIAAALLALWAAYRLAAYRAISESAHGLLNRPDVLASRQEALLSLCFCLPLIAAALFQKAAGDLRIRRQDKLAYKRLQQLAAERRETAAALERERATQATAKLRVAQWRSPEMAERVRSAALQAYRHGYERGQAAHETRFVTDLLQDTVLLKFKHLV